MITQSSEEIHRCINPATFPTEPDPRLRFFMVARRYPPCIVLPLRARPEFAHPTGRLTSCVSDLRSSKLCIAADAL